MQDPLEEIQIRLDNSQHRLEQWQSEARVVADEIKSGLHRVRRLEYIEGVSKQIEALIAERTPADAPLIRIVGALLPRSV